MNEVVTIWDSPDTMLEQPSVGESQASGRAQAVRTCEESLRVHKLSLDSRIGKMVVVQFNVYPWLIEFVTLVINNIWLARMVVLR